MSIFYFFSGVIYFVIQSYKNKIYFTRIQKFSLLIALTVWSPDLITFVGVFAVF